MPRYYPWTPVRKKSGDTDLIYSQFIRYDSKLVLVSRVVFHHELVLCTTRGESASKYPFHCFGRQRA